MVLSSRQDRNKGRVGKGGRYQRPPLKKGAEHKRENHITAGCREKRDLYAYGIFPELVAPCKETSEVS